jgi:hypothetical protein
MRYQETGELHKDFHGAVNCTVKYICDNFGPEALHQIFFNTGHDVYRNIREHLARGDSSELVKFWEYFFDREKAGFSIEQYSEKTVLTVHKCPAVEHIKKLGMKPHPEFCAQTEYMNTGICDGTPYKIITEKTADSSCIQTLKRKNHDSE